MENLLERNKTLNFNKPGKKQFLTRYKRFKYLYIMLIPVIAYYLVFSYWPMYGIQIAFKDYYFNLGIAGSAWTDHNGLGHFITLISDPYFFNVLKNTLVINVMKLIFGFPAPIILAIMLNEIVHMRFKKIVQTITYMPHFFSWVIVAGVVLEMLSPSRGLVNVLLTAAGFEPVFFMAIPALFKPILVASDVWKEVGFGSIVYLAAIAGINTELYEAAEVDGINRIQKIIYITVPSIMPAIVIMLILRSGALISDDFEQVFNLINARVQGVGDVLSTYTYRMGLVDMNFSFGAAVGLFKNIVSLVLVLTANFISRKISEDSLF